MANEERAGFYKSIKFMYGGKLTQDQVDGMEALLDCTEELSIRHRAYILATVFHETAKTMEPIEEYGKGKGKAYGKPAGPYKKIYYGRGYPQLTWYDNYVKAKEITGVDLVKYPELALKKDISAEILVSGMTTGWFTGKKLSNYKTYYSMRKTVNGLDDAKLIAGYAENFEVALKAITIPTKEKPLVSVDETQTKDSFWSYLVKLLYNWSKP